MSIDHARKLVLLAEAESLVRRLATARVPRGERGDAATGIQKNCVARVAAYVRSGPTEGAFRQFLRLLPQIDEFEAQNRANAIRYYAALREELERTRGPANVAEWSFLLGWTARLMTDSARGEDAVSRGGSDRGGWRPGPGGRR